MRNIVFFWFKLLAMFAATMLAGWFLFGSVLRMFPPADYPAIVWAHALLLSFFYGVVWMVSLIAALPDGWAPRGVWRFTLLGFGLVFLSRKSSDGRADAFRKAEYTAWPMGSDWVVFPSIPGWLMRLGRWVKFKWSEQ